MSDQSSPNESPVVIQTEQLTMHYRRCEALRGVDLQIRAGTVFAILGENGAGKTSLIRILTGFQTPTAGTCRVNGLDPLTQGDQVRRLIGYVPDAPPLYGWMTVEQIGSFTASFYWPEYRDRFNQSIAQYKVDPKQKIKYLSKGQRAKVALSLAVSHDPELLILDEPTSGLDPKVRREFLESMIDRAAAGRTVFLSSHQIAEVERVADCVAILHDGVIVMSGSIDEIRSAITRVVVDFDDPHVALPELPPPARVLVDERERTGRRWFVRDFDPEMVDLIRHSPGVLDVRVHPATLEEVFVACTTGNATEVVTS
ncbi:ABC transporter ATP-binding protein [Neorhodopirellula pilleata]|uniref:ABC transporter ATP-binding protein YtrB n=1 Tax=Neorhodopirellula pilleata TaxID=2714738 RepID=A0A5C6ASH9_9BACT|nr:ABC transporter ATP-binding protein [Neorhodopirellula pilleata]TWU02026.1 ABC transporter ATP-binding protein YtrB [Neorhodopirellula pilleata]